MLVRVPPVFFSLPSHGATSVKLRILQNFTLYLRNSWSINLRAIENCICGLRSIERKMRSILRTVRIFKQKSWMAEQCYFSKRLAVVTFEFLNDDARNKTNIS
jgi:hypothetical protein